MPENETLLEVRGLKMWFPITQGIVFQRHVGDIKAVDGLNFHIRRGETLGLVGESGSGKTTVGRCIIRLVDPTAGQIIFEGRDISQMKEAELRGLRKEMQVVFQDPYASLNPRHRIG